MTYREAIDLYQFLVDWNIELNASLAYKLAIIKLQLVNPLKEYSSLFKNIQNEYKTIEDSQINPMRKAEYEEKILQLQSRQINIDIPYISLIELNDIKLNISSITALLPIIKQE